MAKKHQPPTENDIPLIEFEANSAFTSTFQYNLFITEAKKADAFHEKGGKGFVDQEWLTEFAHEIEITEDYKIKKYRPKSRIYAPVSFVSMEHLIPDDIKADLTPFDYQRGGVFSPVVNNLAPSQLTYYTYSSQTEQESLFEERNIGSNKILVMDPSMEKLPSHVRTKIQAAGVSLIKEDLGLIAVYMYPNVVMLTHIFNKGITKLGAEAHELYQEIFNWVYDCHVTRREEIAASVNEGRKKIAIQTMLEYMERQINTTHEEIKTLDSKVNDFRAKLTNAYADLYSKRRIILNFEEDKNKQAEELVLDIQKMEDIPVITKVEFGPQAFEFYTTPLVMTPPDEAWRHCPTDIRDKHGKEWLMAKRRVGPFKITVDYTQSDVRIFPFGDAPLVNNYFGDNAPHPHVNPNDGSACWGNAASPIAELHGNKEFSMLVLFLINYLTTCNPDDPAGRRFYLWPVVEDEEMIEKSEVTEATTE